MKVLIVTLIASLAIVSCLNPDDNTSSYSFNNSSAAVYNLPNGNENQFLLWNLNSNSLFYPTNLPDSLKKDGLQVVFSGAADGTFHDVEYSDTSLDRTVATVIPEVQLFAVKRSQRDMVVTYGTSFGECIGYCKFSMKLSKGKIEYKYESSDTSAYPKIECSSNLPGDSTDLVLDYINKLEVYHLNNIIGCPDCADGGAEWIQVEHGSFSKHITFEYMHEPVALKKVIKVLRRFAGYSECNPD